MISHLGGAFWLPPPRPSLSFHLHHRPHNFVPYGPQWHNIKFESIWLLWSSSQFCPTLMDGSQPFMGSKNHGLTTVVGSIQILQELFSNLWESGTTRNVFHCGLLWMRGPDSSPGWSGQHFNERGRRPQFATGNHKYWQEPKFGLKFTIGQLNILKWIPRIFIIEIQLDIWFAVVFVCVFLLVNHVINWINVSYD